MPQTTITLRDVSIGYKTKTVASGIIAALHSGEMTCLLGANGVGKSTLLKTLAGFIPPLGGEISFAANTQTGVTNVQTGATNAQTVPAAALTPRQRARMMSVVLTQRIDIQDMTVRDVVAMGRTPYTGFWGILSQTDRDAIAASMEATAIAHLADRHITTLSDGERQKAMIAKALAQQTPMIILDEPTAFLDYPSKVETMQLLLSLCHDHGKTVFLSTHDVEIALQTADNLWLMERPSRLTPAEGAQLHCGTPESLARSGAIARFIESDSVTFNPENLTINIKK